MEVGDVAGTDCGGGRADRAGLGEVCGRQALAGGRAVTPTSGLKGDRIQVESPVVAIGVGSGGRGEDGFSMLEVVIALGVLFFVLAGLAHQMTAAFGSVLFARQRQVATAMANEMLEQVRAVPFGSMVMGNADLAGSLATDPALSATGSGQTLVYRFRGREVVRAEVASQPPLVPHVSLVTGSDSTPYTRAIYVTVAPGGDPGVRLVTARVSWARAGRQGAQPLVEVETLVNDHACTAQAGPRPCESYWYSSADAAAAKVQITGTMPGRSGIDTLLTLAKGSSQVITEQLTEVTAVSTTAGATANATGLTSQTVGAGAATASGDDAVTTPRGSYDGPPLTGPATAASTSLSGAGGELLSGTVAASVGAGGTAGAAAAAQAAGQAPPMGGLMDTDGLGHGRMSASQPGMGSATLTLNTDNGNLGTAALLSASASPTGSSGSADRQPGPNTAISDDDSIVGTTTRALGTVDLLGLPSSYVVPSTGPMSAWAGYTVRVSGWSATAKATAGPGALAAHTTRSQAGQLSYWNGAGYTTVDLGSNVVISVPLSVTVVVSGCTVEVNGTLKAGGGTTAVEHEGGGSIGPVSRAASVVNAPAVGSFGYKVTCDTDIVANLTIDVDLGRTLAESRYARPGA